MFYHWIKDSFYGGMFGDFKIIVDRDTGYFNATKLCEQRGKKYERWTSLDRSKNMVSYYYENKLGDMYMGYVVNGNEEDKHITGTYIPKELFLDIASWISFDFYDRCNNIIIDHFVKELKYMDNNNDESYQIQKLEDRMNILTLEMKAEILCQNKKMDKLYEIVTRIDESNQKLENYITSLSLSLSRIIDQNEELIIKTRKHFRM
jgi:hypothetical protein